MQDNKLFDIVVGLTMASLIVVGMSIGSGKFTLNAGAAATVYVWHLIVVVIVSEWLILTHEEGNVRSRNIVLVVLMLFQLVASFCDHSMVNYTVYTTAVAIQCIVYFPKVMRYRKRK